MGKRGPKPKYSDVSCPNSGCALHGVEGAGNIVSNGTYRIKSGSVRKFVCRECGRTFTSRTGTIMEGLHTPSSKVAECISILDAGLGIRATGRIAEVSKDTVKRWNGRRERFRPPRHQENIGSLRAQIQLF